jgi:hypothetical protein
MPVRKPLAGEHYVARGSDGLKAYRVESVSQGTDEVILRSVETGKRFRERHDVFFHVYDRVWKVGTVAQLLGRSPRSIYRYEQLGQIKEPRRYPALGGRRLRFYTKEEVLEMREMIAEVPQGRPRKDGRVVNNTLPSKASLLHELRERFGE